MKRFGALIFVLLLAVFCAIFSGGCSQNQVTPTNEAFSSPILQAFDCVNGEFLYPERLPDKFNSLSGITLEATLLTDYGSVEGLIKSLADPYTRYVLPGKDNVDAVLSGSSFAGIGVTMAVKEGKIRLLYVIPDGPAKLAGLQSGDIITKINDRVTDGLATSEVTDLIRGLPDTTVKLEVLRGETTFVFNITRQYINIKNVYSEVMAGNIGYVKILQFGYSSAADFTQAYNKVANNCVGLIIDLRGNGGGELSNAVSIASSFVPDGQAVMWYKDRWSDARKIAASNGTKITLPVIVLVDEFTASAAELLVASLVDNGLAEAVGTRTYGKGLVQSRYELTDGAHIYLTVAEFFSPTQQKITGQGINPAVIAALSDDDFVGGRDSQLASAMIALASRQRQARAQTVETCRPLAVQTVSLPAVLEKAVDVPVGDGSIL
jgi:carboxyl-terminal processing protease